MREYRKKQWGENRRIMFLCRRMRLFNTYSNWYMLIEYLRLIYVFWKLECSVSCRLCKFLHVMTAFSHAIMHNVSFLLSRSRWMSFHARIRAQLALYAQGQHPGAIFGPLTPWHKHLSCLYHSPGLQEELIKAKLRGQRLTEHDEFDCVPVVLPAVLDLADVLSGVGEREVTDQERSVAF